MFPTSSAAARLIDAEESHVNDLVVVRERRPDDAGPGVPVRPAEADRLVLLLFARGAPLQELPGLVGGGLGQRLLRVALAPAPFAPLRDEQGFHGIALNELGEERRKRRVPRNEVQAGRLAVDEDQDALLAVGQPEALEIAVEVALFGLVNVAHGPGHRRDRHIAAQLGDLVPDLSLVGAELPPRPQALAHSLHVEHAHFLVHDVPGFQEFPRLVAPPAVLDATDWDFDRGLRRDEDGRVEDPVLLGPPELLAVEEEDRDVALVGDRELGDRAALADLGDREDAPLERLPQGDVLRPAVQRPQQLEDGHVLEALPRAELHFQKMKFDRLVHSCVLSFLDFRSNDPNGRPQGRPRSGASPPRAPGPLGVAGFEASHHRPPASIFFILKRSLRSLLRAHRPPRPRTPRPGPCP